jgi:hypothetical protein
MSKQHIMGPGPGEEDAGKSHERERQDDVLEESSRDEPFDEQLQRVRRQDRGRPIPAKERRAP